MGLGAGRPRLMSGTPCFDSSSTAATGNWLSGKGSPGFNPKRKFGQTTSSLKRNSAGWLRGRHRARTRGVEDGLVEARSSAPDLVRHVDGIALAHEVLVPPHAAVGVVSHDLPVRVAPCTITTGTWPSPPCGTMNRTYIWLTVMWPPGPRSPNSACVSSTFSPPTKKLPWAFSTSGVSGVCTSLRACASRRPAAESAPASASPTKMNDRLDAEHSLTSHVSSPLRHEAVRTV